MPCIWLALNQQPSPLSSWKQAGWCWPGALRGGICYPAARQGRHRKDSRPLLPERLWEGADMVSLYILALENMWSAFFPVCRDLLSHFHPLAPTAYTLQVPSTSTVSTFTLNLIIHLCSLARSEFDCTPCEFATLSW